MKTERQCMWCLSPLEATDTNFTCDRCYRWRRGIRKNSTALTECELHELEDYSRFIYTRPLTPQEREIEEISRSVNLARR